MSLGSESPDSEACRARAWSLGQQPASARRASWSWRACKDSESESVSATAVAHTQPEVQVGRTDSVPMPPPLPRPSRSPSRRQVCPGGRHDGLSDRRWSKTAFVRLHKDATDSAGAAVPVALPRRAGPGQACIHPRGGWISALLRRLGRHDRGRDAPPSARAACPDTALAENGLCVICPPSAPYGAAEGQIRTAVLSPRPLILWETQL